MIQRLILLLFGIFLLASCQNESVENEFIDVPAEDAIPVRFSFSLPPSLESSTGYEPMKKINQDEDLYQIGITNTYKAIITKKIDTRWIVDQVLTYVIDDDLGEYSPELNYIKNETKVDDFTVVLRPGTYRITLITGSRSVNWFKDLKQGLIVEDEMDDSYEVPMACHYRTIDGSYIHTGWLGLEEEIFSGYKDFVVEKTKDVHSSSMIKPISMQLNRMVTKMRVALNNTPYTPDSYKFPEDYNNTISAHLVTNDLKGFPTGLNIWGEAHYEGYTPEMRYAVYTGKNVIKYNNTRYLLPIKKSMRQFHSYVFGDKDKDLQVMVSNVVVTFQDGNTTYWTDDKFPLTFKNNYIAGFILKPGNYAEKREEVQEGGGTSTRYYNEMLVEYESGNTPKSPVGIFDNNIEYRLK